VTDRNLCGTPQALFDALHLEFGFTLDAAALPENAKLPRFFTPEEDGLRPPWAGETVWCNPPYVPHGQLRRWAQKAADAAAGGSTSVLLLPASTGSAWWHEVVIPTAAEARFVRDRLRFEGTTDRAPFYSVVVVWRPGSFGLVVSGVSKTGERSTLRARQVAIPQPALPLGAARP
jgi:phage N-6-adenine-methyltransferase